MPSCVVSPVPQGLAFPGVSLLYGVYALLFHPVPFMLQASPLQMVFACCGQGLD